MRRAYRWRYAWIVGLLLVLGSSGLVGCASAFEESDKSQSNPAREDGYLGKFGSESSLADSTSGPAPDLPNGWEDAGWKKKSGGERVFAVKKPDSQSEVELVCTKFMSRTNDVVRSYFETFFDALKENDFRPTSSESFTLDGHRGFRNSFKFTHSGVTLDVHTYNFLFDKIATHMVFYLLPEDRLSDDEKRRLLSYLTHQVHDRFNTNE